MGNEYSSFLLPFMWVLIIIFIAYLGTKWLSKKFFTIYSGRHMHLLERMPIGKDQMLALVTLGQKTFFLGITQNGVNTICVLDQNELETAVPDTSKPDFAALLAGVIKKISLIRPGDKDDADRGNHENNHS